jgi:hypothetical protein
MLSGQWQNPVELHPPFTSTLTSDTSSSSTLPTPNPNNHTPITLQTHHPPKMPRQRSGARPTAPARRPAPAPTQQQTRPATTYAPAAAAPRAPTAGPSAPPTQSPGLFAQMATTAASAFLPSLPLDTRQDRSLTPSQRCRSRLCRRPHPQQRRRRTLRRLVGTRGTRCCTER